jgi:hypothetical protein
MALVSILEEERIITCRGGERIICKRGAGLIRCRWAPKSSAEFGETAFLVWTNTRQSKWRLIILDRRKHSVLFELGIRFAIY